jgi:hypothetical protein
VPDADDAAACASADAEDAALLVEGVGACAAALLTWRLRGNSGAKCGSELAARVRAAAAATLRLLLARRRTPGAALANATRAAAAAELVAEAAAYCRAAAASAAASLPSASVAEDEAALQTRL